VATGTIWSLHQLEVFVTTKTNQSVPKIAGVDQVIAVASGKGGVGKSTVAANLAVALQQAGHTVGLLDADIYGPSQGALLGIPSGTRPNVVNDKLVPIEAHGLFCMSMSFLASSKTPAIWRGPMASGALQQMLSQTAWPNLDYLIIDMPPGTGDIQLTLAQQVPVSGAVIVTTPQDIALLDARKGIEMFRKVAVPVLGLVENMSQFVCPHCGEATEIFGTGGGEAVASEYAVPVLARIPLAAETREKSDAGTPVAGDVRSPSKSLFADLAGQMLTRLAGSEAPVVPVISIVDD